MLSLKKFYIGKLEPQASHPKGIMYIFVSQRIRLLHVRRALEVDVINPNQLLKLVLICERNYQELLIIYIALAEDLTTSHALSQSPLILSDNDPILTT